MLHVDSAFFVKHFDSDNIDSWTLSKPLFRIYSYRYLVKTIPRTLLIETIQHVSSTNI